MTRIYVVGATRGRLAPLFPRLVSASNPQQAIRHVVVGMFDAHPAKQAELVALVQAGVPVEMAGEGIPETCLGDDSGSQEGGNPGPKSGHIEGVLGGVMGRLKG